jgi:predicted deacylase
VRFNNRNNEKFVFAGAGGFFLLLVQPGSEIKKGQKIGEIVDMYSGTVIDSPLAQSDGYLVTLRDYPVVYQKEVLAVLLKKQKFSFWPF